MTASHSLKQLSQKFGVAAAIVAATSYLLVADEGALLKCPIRYFTGIQCPGCGAQRSVRALFSGDIVAAFQLNPLIYVAPIFMLWIYLAERRAKADPRAQASFRVQKIVIISASVILVVVNVVLKNL